MSKQISIKMPDFHKTAVEYFSKIAGAPVDFKVLPCSDIYDQRIQVSIGEKIKIFDCSEMTPEQCLDKINSICLKAGK